MVRIVQWKLGRMAFAFAAYGLLMLGLTAPARAYFDAPDNQTLPRLLLQCSPVLVLKVERVDATKGIVMYQVVDWIQGKEGDEGIRKDTKIKHMPVQEGRIPAGFEKIRPGQLAVFFAADRGYDKSRAIAYVEGVWYYCGRSKEDPSWWPSGWGLNERLDRTFHGPTEDLIRALRDLVAGKEVTVPARKTVPGEGGKTKSFQVRYAMKQPHLAIQLSDALLNVPANTWVHKKTSRNPQALPGIGIGGCIGNNFIMYLRQDKNGVGADYYEIITNSWLGASNEATNWKPLPLPVPAYQSGCYLPGYLRFFLVAPGGTYLGYPPLTGSAGAPLGWAILPNHTRANPPTPQGNPRSAVSYDPELQVALYFATSAPGGVYVADFFNPKLGIHVDNFIDVRGGDEKSKGWQKKWAVPKETQDASIYTTYDTVRKLHVAWLSKEGNGWWTFNPANGDWKPMADLARTWREAGNGGDDPYPEKSVSLAYDQDNHMTVAAIKGKKHGVLELWGYNADKDMWKPLALQGQPPPGTPAWNQLVYDPNHKCFLLLNVLPDGEGRCRTDGFFVVRVQS